MRALLQRVLQSRVTSAVYNDQNAVLKTTTEGIKKGLVVYVCFAPTDVPNHTSVFEMNDYSESILSTCIKKCTQMRIFRDAAGKLNKSVLDTGGSMMLVPNFSLYASYKSGTRPSFSNGLEKAIAEQLFHRLVQISSIVISTAAGVFGSHMEVDMIADGPMNIMLDVPPAPCGSIKLSDT